MNDGKYLNKSFEVKLILRGFTTLPSARVSSHSHSSTHHMGGELPVVVLEGDDGTLARLARHSNLVLQA